MAKPIAIAIIADGKQAAREFDGLGGKAAKWGKRVAAAGVVAAGALAKTVVSAASDAQQSLGATEQIYGKYAKTVIKRSNQAAKAIGLSANEYRELSNVTGAMLKSSGMPLAKVADLTDQLNRRAADLAATFGGTTREAVEAVSSLLRGEADPIERYGVSIKQSDVNARLAAKGLDKLEGSARKAAEQQARLDLLFQQSKDSAGQFARESGTLAGKQQRLAAKIDNVKARVGNVLLPMAAKAADLADRKLVPALERSATWLENNSDEIEAFGRGIGRHALPPLKGLVEIATKAAKWLAELPGPIKTLGVEAGIAALILPRLTAAAVATSTAFTTATARTKQFYAELTYAETRAQRTATVMSKLGGAAKMAAGIGGMVALTESTKQANSTVGILMSTLGGAATGAAFGPFGAVVGGTAGLIGGMWYQTKKANAEFANTKPLTDYRDSLDGITGAISKQTKTRVFDRLEAEGALATARQLGIADRTAVAATLGKEGAIRKLGQAYEKAGVGVEYYKDSTGRLNLLLDTNNVAVADFNSTILGETRALNESSVATRRKALATENLGKVFRGVPKRVVTRLEQTGFDPTLKQLRRLKAQYNLTPKQIRTIIKATDADVSAKKVISYNKTLEKVGKTKPSGNWAKSYKGMLDGAGETSRRTSTTLNQVLSRGIETSRSTARSGSQGIGTDLKTGLPVGFSGADGLWSGIVRSAVASAIRAGKQEADAHSPSRKTAALGRDLADGLVVGMARRQTKVKTAAQKLLGNALAGITDGSKGIDKALDKVTKRIERSITGKNATKREKAVLKHLRDEYKALERNGRAQDKINRKLETAKRLLAERVRAAKDAAKTVLDGFRAYGGVTAGEEGHLNAPAALTAQMEARVKAAERYADLITQLTGKLNKTSLQELIDKGVEGGLAAAEALAAGGQSTIDQVNALQARLDAAGKSVGATAVAEFHQAGIDSAQGFVDGLTKQAAKLDKAAKRLAQQLVKALKKELGIKSPSRVGKELGANFGSSIDLGTKVVPLHRTGRLMARDLVDGFGEPRLTARAAWEQNQAARATAHATPIRLDLHLSADQLTAVEQGRRVVAHLTAYQRAGGRSA